MQAIKYPLVVVCAGAGYGKTSAVHDFTQKNQVDTAWIPLSERDNVGARFWENYTYSISQINEPFGVALRKLGFPDTPDKLKQYMALSDHHVELKRRIFVLDDFHVIEDPSVIRFVEWTISNMPRGNSLFLISRSTPRINIAGMGSRGEIFNMSEEDLRFTENELAQYFRMLTIPLQPDSLREIMQDTDGWAFAINLIARSYRKAPAYGGYLRDAMKTNIFRLMETEIWDGISERLQNFMVRLSLIGHLSADLIALLAGDEQDLVVELERQNAYVRRDSYINAYLIHPLFLEFLAAKEYLLSDEQKRNTYTVAGDWCNRNGFKIDALSYYEKIGDYKSITGVFIGSRSQIPYDVACYAAEIFARTPLEVFDTELYLASTHLRAVMCQGHWEEVIKLAEYYEARYMKLPMDDPYRIFTMSSIYYCWAITRTQMCLTSDVYDFDQYYDKLDKCFPEPTNPGILINKNPGGPWVCIVGSSRKGAPDEFIAALKRSNAYLTHCYIDFETGMDDLACGELLFYKSDIDGAESYIARAYDIARKKNQFGMVHRNLFYMLRIAVLRGNYQRAKQAITKMKINREPSTEEQQNPVATIRNPPLVETGYFNRFIDYDISLCWYYCALGLAENVPDWLKDNFSSYAHAGFIENFANQVKARYCYVIRNYPPLLSYIQEMKQRESFLFGRVEMLAMESCIHYKMKNKEKARAALAEAYETASPNSILLPFIELGKDMRTLTAFALKDPACNIPRYWLESVNRKSASYAKHRAHVVSEYKQAYHIEDDIAITPRESDVFVDLSHGLSRTEIASSRGLSVNTVKMVINNVYMKLGAENLADAIRIATERKII